MASRFPHTWVPVEQYEPAFSLYKAWWTDNGPQKESASTTTMWGATARYTVDENSETVYIVSDSDPPKTINLDHGLVEKAKGEILLRDEYELARDFIIKYAQEFPRRGVVVIGQPGIGL